MKISCFWSWEIPVNIDGPIVVIDAWAATSNLPIILSKKPARLILVNEQNLDRARQFYSQAVLIGESYQKPPISFVVSNAPSDVVKADLKGKTVLFMTINGTRIFEKFKDVRLVIGCAFNNLKSVVKFLQNKDKVTIIMAGDNPNKVLEDKLCAQVLQDELENKTYDWLLLKAKTSRFIQDYYAWPEQTELESLTIIFAKSTYNIIPVSLINKEGFVEIKSLKA
jgi:phosphosulfolactate phosphohydrolase-like enzyme